MPDVTVTIYDWETGERRREILASGQQMNLSKTEHLESVEFYSEDGRSVVEVSCVPCGPKCERIVRHRLGN